MTLTPGMSSFTISPRTADPITSKLGQSLAGCVDTTGIVSCSRHTKKRPSIKSSVIFARPCAVWENVPRRRLQQHHISAQCVILETPDQRQLRVSSASNTVRGVLSAQGDCNRRLWQGAEYVRRERKSRCHGISGAHSLRARDTPIRSLDVSWKDEDMQEGDRTPREYEPSYPD